MVNAAIMFLQTSCIIPQAILLYRGRDRILPERYFSLGRLGTAVNAIAVAWVIFLDILYCFPAFKPVTPQSMSYVSVVCVGLLSFVIVLWFTTKRGQFKGPQINLGIMRDRRLMALETQLAGVETTNRHKDRLKE